MTMIAQSKQKTIVILLNNVFITKIVLKQI